MGRRLMSRLIVKIHSLEEILAVEPNHVWSRECVESSIPFSHKIIKFYYFIYEKSNSKPHFNFTTYYELKNSNTVWYHIIYKEGIKILC